MFQLKKKAIVIVLQESLLSIFLKKTDDCLSFLDKAPSCFAPHTYTGKEAEGEGLLWGPPRPALLPQPWSSKLELYREPK